MRKTSRIPNKAEMLLSKELLQLRERQGMARRELAKALRQKEQDVTRYETGGFVPLPVLEEIAKVLGQPVQKKFIRRISFLRKLEMETGEFQEELLTLYGELFEE